MQVLKIKDNVDLKEYGFEKDDEDFIYSDSYDLLVNYDRSILTGQFFGDNESRRLFRLYDLIKADIVELVEV